MSGRNGKAPLSVLDFYQATIPRLKKILGESLVDRKPGVMPTGMTDVSHLVEPIGTVCSGVYRIYLGRNNHGKPVFCLDTWPAAYPAGTWIHELQFWNRQGWHAVLAQYQKIVDDRAARSLQSP